MDKLGLVYHIPDPNNPGLENGYVGVVNKNKGVYKRFREHINSSRIMSHYIKENSVVFESVKIIFEGNLKECYQYEEKLRPTQNIGWNLAKGGGGPYYSEINDLNEYRSFIQSERMKNENLKMQQAETFKLNYYENIESQKLRSKRAKEHMADPEKKKRCMQNLHVKHKCPHCDFKSNKGNLTKHIRKMHCGN